MSHLRGLMNTSTIDDIVNMTIDNVDAIDANMRHLRTGAGDTTYNNFKIWFGIIGFLLCIKFILTIANDMKKMNEKKYTPRISEQIYAGLPPPLILTPSANGVTIHYDSLKSYNKKVMSTKHKKPRKMSQQDVAIPINI